MSSQLQQLISNRLSELGINPFEAARNGGLERSYINDILIGKKTTVRFNKLGQLATALRLDPRDLNVALVAGQQASHSVPLMGFLGAGAEVEPDFEQVPPDGLDTVDLPFPIPDDMIAFKVRGTSMLPVYRPDHIIVVYREQRKPIESFFGLEAAVRTSDGRRYIKTIERGIGGTYLRSWNDINPIGPVRIEWVGEIFATLPPPATKKVIRQGGIQGEFQLKAG